jgi:hypothetical protein
MEHTRSFEDPILDILSHSKILISECEPFSHKKLKISKRIHLF